MNNPDKSKSNKEGKPKKQEELDQLTLSLINRQIKRKKEKNKANIVENQIKRRSDTIDEWMNDSSYFFVGTRTKRNSPSLNCFELVHFKMISSGLDFSGKQYLISISNKYFNQSIHIGIPIYSTTQRELLVIERRGRKGWIVNVMIE